MVISLKKGWSYNWMWKNIFIKNSLLLFAEKSVIRLCVCVHLVHVLSILFFVPTSTIFNETLHAFYAESEWFFIFSFLFPNSINLWSKKVFSCWLRLFIVRARTNNHSIGVKSGHIYILSDKKDVQNTIRIRDNRSRFKHVKKTSTHSSGWKTVVK